jgi:5'-3' exonuclease
VYDEAAVKARFGVPPQSIPDYLALVGDSADGFPGLPGWGAKSAAAVLSRYQHLEGIPTDVCEWDVPVRGAAKLAATLRKSFDAALLFRDLATLRTTAPVGKPSDWRWPGPTDRFPAVAEALRASQLADRAGTLAGTA